MGWQREEVKGRTCRRRRRERRSASTCDVGPTQLSNQEQRTTTRLHNIEYVRGQLEMACSINTDHVEMPSVGIDVGFGVGLRQQDTAGSP